MPVGWPGGSGCLRFIRIRPIERHGCGVLMEPGRRNGIDLERFEGDGTKHSIEVGRKQRIQDMPQPIIMQRGAREPWLQQCHHATLCQPFAYLVERMIAIENRQHQGFAPTPTREHMRRVG
jgi:hypothetical protein